jgi:hypothetical protein
MSASARPTKALLLALSALAACGGSELPVPAPVSVTPDRGPAGQATPVVIRGTGFVANLVQPSSGGTPTVDVTFRAWLGGAALDDVRRIDDTSISATVPAGLADGLQSLRVEGPYGTSGELPGAFTVEGAAAAALSATIAATPAAVTVGQVVTVTLTVQNTGGVDLGDLTPGAPSISGTATTGPPSGPTPASIASLAPGASGTFTWTYATSGPGTLSFTGSVTARSISAGGTVSAASDPTRPAEVAVERPAALAASLPASGAAALGREFTVAMTVVNSGGGAVRNVTPGTPSVAPAGLAGVKPGTGPVPAQVASLAAGASTTFTWTFVAGNTPGTLRVSAAASGVDAISGATVSSPTATSGDITIGSAALQATLAVTPTRASVGQPVTLSLTVSNPGQAAVNGFSIAGPVAASTDGASATVTGGPSPAPPPTLAAGQSVTVGWSVSPAVAPGADTGHLTFGVTASGTDAFSGGPISSDPTAAFTIDTPASVTATGLASTPASPVAGQTFSVSLGLAKSGGAAASVTDATLTGVACSTPPSFPVAAASAAFPITWSGCAAPATPQALTLDASALWVDANLPGTIHATATVSATVPVQAAAGLSVAFAAEPPSPVVEGQVLTLTANVTNTAGAFGLAANGVTVTPSFTTVSGNAAAACGAATPGATAIAAGATQAFAFTCTVTGSGTITFTASAAGTSAVTAAPISAAATTAPPTTVQAAGALAVAFAAQPPSPTTTGTSITLTANVTNTAPAGGAPVNAVTMTATPTTVTGSATANCGAATPGTTSIPAGATQAYSVTCAVSGIGTLTFTATASGTAPGSGAALSASVTSSPATSVQAVAGLSVAFAAQPPSPVSDGQVLTLTARVANTALAGGEAASGVTVAPSVTRVGGTASATCGAPAPGATTIGAGFSQDYDFTCTVTGSGTITFTASANGRGAITDTPITGAATTAPATTVQVPAGVTATAVTPSATTVSTGQPFSVTLGLAKTGEAAADVVAASLTGAGVACSGVPAPVSGIAAAQVLTWTGCTATASGDLQASATWVDANLGGPGTATNVVTAPLVVQAAAVVTMAGFTVTPSPVPQDVSFSVTVLLERTGEAPADVLTASLSGPGLACTPPGLPVLGMGTSAPLTWTACAPYGSPRNVPIQVTVGWIDENWPANPRTTGPVSGAIDIQ